MASLGEFIRHRLDETDLSLREFARQGGCSAPFASEVERGRRFPLDVMFDNMARILQVYVEELSSLDPRPPIAEMRRQAAHTEITCFKEVNYPSGIIQIG